MARLSAWWQDAALALRRGGAALNISPDPPPPRLHHFTDCAGLIGIFEQKTLWASLATSMNDPSEIAFGLELAHELFETGAIAAKHVDLAQVDTLAAQLAAESRAYVVSFCANLNLAGQWLHYGRSGSGVAVGFHGSMLEQKPFALFRVLYDRAEQARLVTAVVETVDGTIDEIWASLTSPQDKEALLTIARETVADLLWRVSPRLKHPAFKAEDEWRLIAYESREQAEPDSDDPAPATHFRGSAGRVVPYKKIEYDPLPAFEVVLGASCPMGPEELGIRVLMDAKLRNRLTVSTSTVPVRA